MDNLVCTACRATYYSAAARTMIVRGERCDCGGRLRLVRDGPPVPVAVPPAREPNGTDAPPPNVRRFNRD